MINFNQLAPDALNQNKTMAFQYDYNAAKRMLAKQLGLPATASAQELVNTIIQVVTAEALSLLNDTENPSQDKYVSLTVWGSAIHSNALKPLPGQQFPNNIVYDLIAATRNKANEKNQENLLMKFFMDGINAHKIHQAQPPARFISTAELVNLISVMAPSIKNYATSREKAFVDKYEAYSKSSSELFDKLSAFAGTVKADPVYANLSYYDGKSGVLDFQRHENLATGAMAYHLDDAIRAGVSLGTAIGSEAQVVAMAEKLSKGLLEVLKDFITPKYEKRNSINSNDKLFDSLEDWDLSEYLSRIVVALKIAEGQYPNNQAIKSACDNVMKNSIVEAVYSRSQAGNFEGARERNADVDALRISKVFTQAHIQEARGNHLCNMH